ncbi:hypothetical protein H9P43_002504 [Blastocladiella emersonii ATCC 22665]|nr:hypothetical protein H9P43_002504 [Blastocladiella emersonii ATCC 22665]
MQPVSLPTNTMKSTLRAITTAVAQIGSVRTPTHKRAAFAAAPDAVRATLRFVSDPRVTFGVTRKAAESALLRAPPALFDERRIPASLEQLLREMNQGGWSARNDRDAMLSNLAPKFDLDADEVETLVRLLDRNLKIGLGQAMWRDLAATPAERAVFEEKFALSVRGEVSPPSKPVAVAAKPQSAAGTAAAPTAAAPKPAAAPTQQQAPGRIEHFPGVALGYPFNGKLEPGARYLVSRKLDGVRVIAVVHRPPPDAPPSIECYSRTGKPLTVPTGVLDDLGRLVAPGETRVFDGELCIPGDSGDADQFDTVISSVRTLAADKVKKKRPKKRATSADDTTISYYVFDVLSLPELMSRTSSRTLAERLDAFTAEARTPSPWRVAELSNTAYAVPASPTTTRVNLVTHQVAQSEPDIASAMSAASKHAWEGVMVRRDTLYRGTRHRDVGKVKRWQDAEFVVEGVDVDPNMTLTQNMFPAAIPGDMRAFLPGPIDVLNGGGAVTGVRFLRALTVRTSDGVAVAVGSGMTLRQRLEWAAHPDRIVGRTVTVRYFEQTKDGSLRFPSLKAVFGPQGRDV